MRHKVFSLLIIMVLTLYMSGCSINDNKIVAKSVESGQQKMNIAGTNKDEFATNKDAYATKEWVYKTFSLTDEDFKGIDLDVVFEVYPIEKETLADYGPEKVVSRLTHYYSKALEKKEAMKYDKSYLVKAEKSYAKFPSFDTIKYFALDVARGDGNGSYLIDFDQAIMYFSLGYPVAYKDFRKSKYTIKLSKDDIAKIKEVLKSYEVANWDYSYYSTSKTRNEFGWNLGIEFVDGTIISKFGNWGPSNFIEFEDAIAGIRMKYKK